MRIFLAGATGAIGRRLIPLLVAEGHHVVGSTRSPDKADSLRASDVEPAVMDGLDRESVLRAVINAKPDVVIHQLTALAQMGGDMRKIDQDFVETNRLRIKGTDYLIEAARTAGARRFLAQSFTGWPYARVGGPVKTEEDPLDPTPPAQMRTVLDAIKHLETTVTGAADMEGLVLRYGYFYGPGTSLGRGGQHVEMVRARKFPIVGKGTGVWSFTHTDDAAAATVAAVDRGESGLYNIVDDEPAPVSDWLPALAHAIGAKPPRRVPLWLVRSMIGEAGVAAMTNIRGASNAKAKRELGWQPIYPSWRQGFRIGLG